MKLHRAIKEAQKQKPKDPKAVPDLKTDKFIKFKLHCMACGEETGTTRDIRQTLIDPATLKEEGVDMNDPRMREGLCKRCSDAIGRGQTILINQSATKSVILKLEANEKLAEEARGKVISIPDDKFEEMLNGQNT